MARESKAVKEIKERILAIDDLISNCEADINNRKFKISQYETAREELCQLLLTLEPAKVRKNEVKV